MSDTYKLTGSNTTDIQIYAASGVTADIVCDNAFIKNTKGGYEFRTEQVDDIAGRYYLEGRNYICPFGTDTTGKITLSGKLVVDTYSALDVYSNGEYYGSFVAPVADDEYSHVSGAFTQISSFTNGKEDAAFYLKDAQYNASDYAGDCLCIKVNGNAAGVYTFTAGTDSVPQLYYYDDHSFIGDSDTCVNCGVEWYTVTFDDGSDNPKTERVIKDSAVSAPESYPTAPVGKKFTGWYADEECTDKYVFEKPVTKDITLYAGWEALPVQSIAVKTAPTKTSYIEGKKFDPTGLVINAVYENGTLEVAYTDETKGDFTFSPALTKELTVADEKVTITYGEKTAQQTITVAEKQLSSIAVKTAPKKTSYIAGEKFDLTGLVITLTYNNGETEYVAYSDSTKDGFTFAPETLSTDDKKVTITYGGKSVEQAVKVSSKSSGGSSGGRSPSTTTPTTTNPSIGGSSKSWSDVAADLGKLTSDSEATIELNGSTTVPVDVIKSIADTGSNVKLVINSAYAWVVDGADITAPAAADLTFTKTTSTKSDGLRGTEGTQFKINNTNIPTTLEISFKSSHAGKFANLYKNVDGKLTFVTNAKLGADGKVVLPEVTEKGDYVSMLCEYSDRPGDMDNDGIMNAKDSLAIIKDFIGLEKGVNPLVADINNDGFINAKDSLMILKKTVGLA